MTTRRNRTAGDPLHVIGYLRVSTQEQADSGAGIGAQRAAIMAEADRRGWTVVRWCSDEGVSGKSMKGRLGLAEALGMIRAGEAAALVASKLDRLFRSLQDFASLMATSQAEGWAIVALDVGVDTSTPQGEFLATIMAGAAQWERRIIGQRTREGLAVKRAQGVRLGGPQAVPQDVAERIAADRARGVTFAAIAEDLNREGIPTARGGARWYPSSVRAILRSQATPEGRELLGVAR